MTGRYQKCSARARFHQQATFFYNSKVVCDDIEPVLPCIGERQSTNSENCGDSRIAPRASSFIRQRQCSRTMECEWTNSHRFTVNAPVLQHGKKKKCVLTFDVAIQGVESLQYASTP